MTDPLDPDRDWLQPHPSRLSPSHPARRQILQAHAAAVDADELGYADPVSGLFVMTSVALAERGTCCENGCRHCPYVR